MVEVRKIHTVTITMGTKDNSGGQSRKMTQLQEKVSCLLQEARILLDLTKLTNCTVPYKMVIDDNELSMNERLRLINGIILEIQRSSILPLRLLDVFHMMKDYLLVGCSADGIHFDRPKGAEWLNQVVQRHINNLESDLLETGQINFGPTPRPLFFQVGSELSKDARYGENFGAAKLAKALAA